jgi:hypothetical protein
MIQARTKLQAIQKELFKSHQEGQSGSDGHADLKTRADQARQELRVAQEALSAARAALPRGSADPSVQEEAGALVAKTLESSQDRKGQRW